MTLATQPTRPLATHHRWALLGAALTSAIALTDAVTHGLTGRSSAFADGSGTTWLVVLGDLVHGLTYVALVLVLVREADRFGPTSVVARGTRKLVLVSLGTLAAGFLTIVPVTHVTGVESGAFVTAFGVVATVAFLGMILGATVLGLALLPTRALGLGARILALLLPVLGGTFLLAWLAPAWAHPGYLETTLHLGLALLGVAVAAQPATRPAMASPTSAVDRD